ncbi:Prephenate dehydrogenase TyrA [Methanonatronarchaeum thermophilum]|uniref:Prephenate dehydrogenase TyrA n=1 Tax=Methanonatronarchaeum thermophilum TaxID=1927129 RepID=A0A1Y3GDE5_9EURY|nr:prephenate dehydrogenase/arogenate dehydrogenase family protein [Methanonatronarchaeum thermophilum]OUJ18333.1 Prephenate dehydrogenase TyrA [Methanonatronarchaeum thermophilum]
MNKKQKITIVGGAGRMGHWIAQNLKNQNTEIHITDKNKKKGKKTARKLEIKYHQNYSPIKNSDIVIISVPIKATTKVIKEVGPKMKKNSLLMDVTSIKEQPVNAMKKHVPKHVEKIGTHPLFGPEGTTFKDKNIVLVPINADKWLDKVKKYITNQGGNIRTMTASEHDKAMAVVQGASHLLLILFGSILKNQKFNINQNNDLTTPTFRLLHKDLDRILVQNPELYASIQTHNRYIPMIHKKTIKDYQKMLETIETQDTEKLSQIIENIDNYIQNQKNQKNTNLEN